MRKIKKIILHCSASDDSLDIGAKEIKELHTSKGIVKWNGQKMPGFGWSDIGYHVVIRKNGVAEAGRPLERPGAHVEGHNEDSIGICWVGLNDLNNSQFQTLVALIRGYMNQFNLEITDVYGHYEFNPKKTCPNIDMVHFRAELLFLPGSIGDVR